MGVLKVFSKEDRLNYFLENISFWNFDIIKYNETTIMASKNDVNIIDILKEDSEYTITWHGPDSKKIAKSYYNLFKNTEGAYLVSSTHTFPPEPIGGKRSPSPPVDPKEVSAMKRAWFTYGFAACLILALIVAIALGTFNGDAPAETTPAPTTMPPTSAPPTTPAETTPAPTTMPPTTAPPPSMDTLLRQMEDTLAEKGVADATAALYENSERYLFVEYTRTIPAGDAPSSTAMRAIISAYAELTLTHDVATRLVAAEMQEDSSQQAWYCLTAWVTAYNRGYYTLDDVYARVMGTASYQ